MKFLLVTSLIVFAAPLAAQKTEIRLGAFSSSSRRNVGLDTASFGETSAGRTGGEFLLRGEGAGLSARYAKGRFGPPLTVGGYQNLTELDASVLIGPRPFAVQVGYRRRATGAELFGDGDGENLILAGANSFVSLGPSGLAITFAGGAAGRIGRDSVTKTGNGKVEVAGWHLSTGLLYQAPRRIPAFVFLGYRFDRFKSRAAGGLIGRKEEMSGVVIEGGLRWLP